MPLMFHAQFGLSLHAHALPNSKCLFWLEPRSGMRLPVSHKPLPLGMKRTCFCKKEPARKEIKCVCSTFCWLGLDLSFSCTTLGEFERLLSQTRRRNGASSWVSVVDPVASWFVCPGRLVCVSVFAARVNLASCLCRPRLRFPWYCKS